MAVTITDVGVDSTAGVGVALTTTGVGVDSTVGVGVAVTTTGVGVDSTVGVGVAVTTTGVGVDSTVGVGVAVTTTGVGVGADEQAATTRSAVSATDSLLSISFSLPAGARRARLLRRSTRSKLACAFADS